jgi:hypothetical protein
MVNTLRIDPASKLCEYTLGGTTLANYLLLAAVLVAGASYWAPWIDHEAAALRLTGQDLGEFVKFLPASGGAFEGLRPARTWRQLFYVPPFACAICLTLIAANRRFAYPRWSRSIMLVLALLFLLGLFPPVWGHPRDLLSGEFRLQGYALIFGALFVLAHGLFGRMPPRWSAAVVSALSGIALALAVGAFWHVRPRLWAAYNTPTISLGWGLWLHTAAWVASAGLGAYIYVWWTMKRPALVRE